MNQEEFKQRYKYDPVKDRLGEGGFGEVFKTYDNFLDKWVAIKISKVKADFQELRLKKEVELLNLLPAHPNIARYEECYTFKTISGEHDIAVLQYYESGNLLQVLTKQELSLNQKYYLLTSLLEGIRFIHSQGIIHRDLKPQNVLIVYRDNNYIPKITDFGISKKLNLLKTTQFSNSLIGAGTITYSSPEQLADISIRKNTDLWSFGIIAFQVLTGETPFNSGSHSTSSELGRQEMMKQINSGKLPELINQVPVPWKQIIEKCLIIDPEKRIKDVESCIDMLKGINISENKKTISRKMTIVDDETQIVSTGKTGKKNNIKNHLQKKIIIIGISAAIVLLLAFSIIYLQQNKSQDLVNLISNDSLPIVNVPQEKTELIGDTATLIVETNNEKLPEQPAPQKPSITKKSTEGEIKFPNGDIYIGEILNGKMHGKGKYLYKTGGLISEDDPMERRAEAGDYIEGEWADGGLYKGNLFDKSGLLKSKRIIIGRN